MKNKNLIFRIVIILLVVSSLILLFINMRVSNLESVKIKEFNNEVIDYLDVVNESEDEGRYVLFAVKYLNDKTSKTSFTDYEIIDTINMYFNEEYSLEKLEKVGITKDMADEGITHEDNSYNYNKVSSKKDIADRKIIKYEEIKVKKKNSNKFVAYFKKLVVDNPYDILNYYNNKDIDSDEKTDISGVTAYLNGTKGVRTIKKFINEDSISNYGKDEGEIKVTYIITDGKFVIDNIE